MTGYALLGLKKGDYFRTLLTNRVGHLLKIEHDSLHVAWQDRKGPERVHRELVVEPYPRPLTVSDFK